MNNRSCTLLRSLIWVVLVCLIGFSFGCASSGKRVSLNETAQNSREVQPEGSSEQSDSDKPDSQIQSESILSPGYLLRISQLEDEKLNGKFRMDFEGNLKLPYNVNVVATGFTMPELRKRVAEAYKSFFKSSAPMEISLIDSTYWIEVRGIVKKPGRFLVRKSTSLEEVLSMAGGLNTGSTGSNDVGFLKVVQGKNTFAVDLEQYFDTGKRVRKIDWKGGDLLFFQRDLDPEEMTNKNFEIQKTVKLLGEVRKPGDIAYRKNADFYYYLSKAGGPTTAADMDSISVIRGKDYERKSILFSGAEAGKIPKLEEGDLLLVNADKPSFFQKFVTASSTLVTVVTSIALVIIALNR